MKAFWGVDNDGVHWYGKRGQPMARVSPDSMFCCRFWRVEVYADRGWPVVEATARVATAAQARRDVERWVSCRGLKAGVG